MKEEALLMEVSGRLRPQPGSGSRVILRGIAGWRVPKIKAWA